MENIMNSTTFRKFKLEKNRRINNAIFKAGNIYMNILGDGMVRKAQSAFLSMARVTSFRDKLPPKPREIFDSIFGSEKTDDSEQKLGAAGKLAKMGIVLTIFAGIKGIAGGCFDDLSHAVNMGIDEMGNPLGPKVAYAAEPDSDIVMGSTGNDTVTDTASSISEPISVDTVETDNTISEPISVDTDTLTDETLTSDNEEVVTIDNGNDEFSVDVNGDGNEDANVESEEPITEEELTTDEKDQLDTSVDENDIVVDTSKYEDADIAFTIHKDIDDLDNLYANLDDETKKNFSIESNTSVDVSTDGSYVISGEFDTSDKQVIVIDTDKGEVVIAMNEYFDGSKTPTTVNDSMLSIIINNLKEQNPEMFENKNITIGRTDLEVPVCKVDLDDDGVYDLFISEKDGNTVIEGNCIKSVDEVIANNKAKEDVINTPEKDVKIPAEPDTPVTPPEPDTPVTPPDEQSPQQENSSNKLPQTGDNIRVLAGVATAAATGAVTAGIAMKKSHDKMKFATEGLANEETIGEAYDGTISRERYDGLIEEAYDGTISRERFDELIEDLIKLGEFPWLNKFCDDEKLTQTEAKLTKSSGRAR